MDIQLNAPIDKNKIKEPLYCFGTYYSKDKLPEHESDMKKISDEQLDFKADLVKVYESQESTVKKFWHMGAYEMWTVYEPSSEK